MEGLFNIRPSLFWVKRTTFGRDRLTTFFV